MTSAIGRGGNLELRKAGKGEAVRQMSLPAFVASTMRAWLKGRGGDVIADASL
jgi:hypothetical protein